MVIQQKKRSEIDDKYKWDLTALFETDVKWQEAHDEIISKLPEVEAFKGKLANADTLLECLTYLDVMLEWTEKCFVYANMKLHEDGSVSKYQGFVSKAEGLVAKVSQAASFVEPELLSIPQETLDSFLSQNEGLQLYKHWLDNVTRLRAHVLSPELESLLATTGEMARTAENVYEIFCNTDMKFGTVKDDNGNEVELTFGRYGSLLESPNVEVRRGAFKAMYAQYTNYKNTIATLYSNSVKKDIFYAKARKFDSCADAVMAERNIPKEVVTNLIETVHEYLPYMYEYLKIRKRELGLDELHVYDTYTPIVKNVDTNVSFDEAKKTVLEALKPLGEDYCSVLERSFNEGWIDVYENAGKRSGAYCWGAFGAHPYVLLNYDNKVSDMFTLAHEMGHAMHAHYSWTTQPFVYSGHTIFTAEVASTANEALLMDYLLKNNKDEAFGKYLINYFMDQFRGTVFRQTMFAEFEMKAHEMEERGESLTVDSLSELYLSLVKLYFGDEVVLDEEIALEWSRIPHFYTPYYVFQYATGFSAAIAFSRLILDKGKEAADRYIDCFLKGGNSKYSIDILKDAGVDMSSPEPVRAALEVFKELVQKF